jgi:hypothetical protein
MKSTVRSSRYTKVVQGALASFPQLHSARSRKLQLRTSSAQPGVAARLGEGYQLRERALVSGYPR